MILFTPIRYSLVVCATSLLLSGCGNASGVFPPGPMQQNAAQPLWPANAAAVKALSLHGERLAATSVSVSGCYYPRHSSFSAYGQATGPYPGTFTAGGSWEWINFYGQPKWNFSEVFTIYTTASHSINGHMGPFLINGKTACRHFSRRGLPYNSDAGQGKATVHITTTRFKEVFTS